jgi:hypothetical protein
MIRTLGVAFGLFLALTLTCGAARAKMEFCPAGLQYRPAIPATSDGRSAGLVFGLWSDSPRTIVTAKIVAETDGGWYAWDVSNLLLVEGANGVAESPRTVAVFDKPVFVRHIWIVEARTSGDTLYGWDAVGEASCGIPSFSHPSYASQKAQDPSGLPHLTASPVAPLYAANCPHPFSEAIVTHPVQPIFPPLAPKGLYYTSQIEVAIGDSDNLLDAWVYKSSGNRAIDASALAAARASSYQSAVSYCQKADGYYLFRADFEPR